MTEDESRKISDLHRFFMEPTGPGRPSRAKEIDDALTAIRAGRLLTKLSLWLLGAIAAVAAAWASIKGIMK